MTWTAVCASLLPPHHWPKTTCKLCIIDRSPCLLLLSPRPHPHPPRLQNLMLSPHHHKQLPITTTIGRCSSTSPGHDTFSQPSQDLNLKNQQKPPGGFWMKWKEKSSGMSRKLAKLGLAAVLAYGVFDGFTYTTFFVLAFLGYEKSTGNNPAANLKALLGIVILMWTGNNITRPFRVAGAAALAPFIDKALRRIQKHFNFPNLVYAFALVVAIVAASCFTVVSLLILSRLR